jgi:hypothetical protein
MQPSRRQMIAGGLGLTAAALLKGCATGKATSTLPGVPWPDVASRPRFDDTTVTQPMPAPPSDVRGVIARTQWTSAKPIASRVNPMRGVTRITCHHEGATDSPVYFSDYATTKQRIELIRKFHLSRGWGDIGYHYIVDRAGRVWQGRPVSLQGAHVSENNEHNIGVMCLGNFDLQSPSSAQLKALQTIVRDLRRNNSVRANRIYTHQELRPTACPGRSLQPKIATLRSNGAFT